MGEEGGGIKCRLFELNHSNASPLDAVWVDALSGPNRIIFRLTAELPRRAQILGNIRSFHGPRNC